MSDDHRVNSDHEPAAIEVPDELPERPRWWLRNPAAGVLTTAVLGVATIWVTLSIRSPDSAPGSTLISLVILPIALLLPAIALGGAFVAWHSFQATRGGMRLSLAAPAAIAMILNIAAVGLFMRWVVLVFFG